MILVSSSYGFEWINYENLEHSYVYRSETNVLGIVHRAARIGSSHGCLHGPVGRELVIVISFVHQSEAKGLDNGNRTKVSRPTLSKRRLLSKPYKVACFPLQVAALGPCRLDPRWYNGVDGADIESQQVHPKDTASSFAVLAPNLTKTQNVKKSAIRSSLQ